MGGGGDKRREAEGEQRGTGIAALASLPEAPGKRKKKKTSFGGETWKVRESC